MMRTSEARSLVLSGTSPAAPGKAELARIRGLARYEALRIDALIQGATGGVLDLYLQRRIMNGATPIWLDWLHFTQLSAGGAAIVYSTWAGDNAPNVSLVTVGQMSDDLSTGAFALAANTFIGGLPGDELRLVANAGASTSAGAVQSVYLTGFERYT
jgi:hypothetical protein